MIRACTFANVLILCSCRKQNQPTWEHGVPLQFEDAALTAANFASLVQNGAAFVVHNTARNSGLWNWTCASIRRDAVFQDAEGQLSYADDGKSAKLSEPWEDQAASTAAGNFDPKAPRRGSLYFGIKDLQFDDSHVPASWNMLMLEKIQNLTRLPRYMDSRNLWRQNPEGVSERDSLHSSPELWLSPPSAGAQAHMDHHVSTTVSLQLSGNKRWRLQQIPSRSSVAKHADYGDGAVYRRKRPWKPQHDFVLQAGDALFFPPGTIHETHTLEPDCATSITYQFSVPMPARYYRGLAQRFRRTRDMEESWELMRRWASLNGEGENAFQRASSQQSKLSLEELLQGAHDEDQALSLRDAFAFLDHDADGAIEVEDLRQAMDELRIAAVPHPAAHGGRARDHKSDL